MALTVAAWLALLFLAGIVGFNAVTFAVAFSRGPRPPRLPVAFLKECLATLAVIPAWPLFALLGASYQARKEGTDPDPGDALPPVILVHGYAMNRTNWLWLGAVLSRRGIGPLYGFSYLSLRAIEESAKQLAAYVERVVSRDRVERIDLVAHSLGGLVARWYIERMGGARRVRRLITIATPHHGTAWGRFAVGAVRRDMAGDSPFFSALGAPPTTVDYTSIWSRCDNLVIPADSARLGEDVVFDDLGHLGLLVSPRVADAVADRLRAR
ncbi:MAG: hypothetical protein EXR72_11490 [Myxococcales bacterium]|nr:hypothetical protein [Myxococcales bacterium]